MAVKTAGAVYAFNKIISAKKSLRFSGPWKNSSLYEEDTEKDGSHIIYNVTISIQVSVTLDYRTD